MSWKKFQLAISQRLLKDNVSNAISISLIRLVRLLK